MHAPVAKTQMVIRRPIGEVFEAFVDPAITSRFWFSRSTGRMAVGQTVRWDWDMYGVSPNVDVKAVERNRRILIEWDGPDNPSWVEWTFEPNIRGPNVRRREELGLPRRCRQDCDGGDDVNGRLQLRARRIESVRGATTST